MPVMKAITLFIISSSLLIASCNPVGDNPGDGFSTEELKPLGDMGYGADNYACTMDCYSKLVVKADTNFVINSVSDYEKLKARAACLEIIAWPEVDFEKNTLLAGSLITSSSCCKILELTLAYDPFKVEYNIVLTMLPGPNQNPGALYFWALAKKMPPGTVVSFHYKFNSTI